MIPNFNLECKKQLTVLHWRSSWHQCRQLVLELVAVVQDISIRVRFFHRCTVFGTWDPTRVVLVPILHRLADKGYSNFPSMPWYSSKLLLIYWNSSSLLRTSKQRCKHAWSWFEASCQKNIAVLTKDVAVVLFVLNKLVKCKTSEQLYKWL